MFIALETLNKLNEVISQYYDGILSADRAILFISYTLNHREVENDNS